MAADLAESQDTQAASPHMSLTRLYIAPPVTAGETQPLPDELVPHLRARRLRPGDALVLFDGRGTEFPARLETLERRAATVTVKPGVTRDAESPLAISVLQGISKGDRMDFAVQKAVELGVAEIRPVFTDNSVVRLDAARAEKRREHWQRIAIAACEQCGRNRVPAVHSPVDLGDLWEALTPSRCVVMDPSGDRSALTLSPPAGVLSLLVGPEGGLSETELARAGAERWQRLRLGPRVLRTETATVAALTALQLVLGDLGLPAPPTPGA